MPRTDITTTASPHGKFGETTTNPVGAVDNWDICDSTNKALATKIALIMVFFFILITR